MKNTNSFGVHFVLRRNKAVDGKCPVYVRIIVNKSRVEMAMKKSLPEKDWNDGKGAAKSNTQQLKEFNSFLEEVRSKLVTHYQEFILHGENVSAEAVKSAYLGMDADALEILKECTQEKTLLWLVKEHNTVMQQVLKKGSMKNYFTTERYVKKFLKEKYPAGDIALKELTYSFLTAFEFYVRTTPLKANDPCTTNGTMKHRERIKKMATWATNNEWIPKNPFTAYSLKFKHADREILNEQDLEIIENYHFENPMRENVKDLFVFCCYTGLSYVDVMGLKPANIVSSLDGFQWIKTNRAKTDVAVDVPLLEQAVLIWEKFKNRKGELPRDTVFPYITNQEMNRSLKVIGEVCSITKILTFHLARHTFATTVTLCNGIPIESISKMLGHTKLTTTMLYAKVVKTKLSMYMALLQSKLNKSNKHLSIAI